MHARALQRHSLSVGGSATRSVANIRRSLKKELTVEAPRSVVPLRGCPLPSASGNKAVDGAIKKLFCYDAAYAECCAAVRSADGAPDALVSLGPKVSWPDVVAGCGGRVDWLSACGRCVGLFG